MSNDVTKPFSLEDDEPIRPINLDNTQIDNSDFVPLANNNSAEIKNTDSNFIFFSSGSFHLGDQQFELPNMQRDNI